MTKTNKLLLVSTCLILAFGIARHQSRRLQLLVSYGTKPDKREWRGRLNLVFAGNSKVERGVSPAAVVSVLGPARAGNFAYSACGFGSNYLAEISRLLDMSQQEKIIVLGISVSTLSERNANLDNEFLRMYRNPYQVELLESRLPRVYDFLKPLDWGVFGYLLKPSKKYTSFEIRHADGWEASWRIPELRIQVQKPRERVGYARVSDKVIQKLLQQVSMWTSQGVEVFGFDAPPQTMERVGSKSYGFDPDGFIQDFQKAGAVWLKFEDSKYHSYDGGAHLRNDAALIFSTDLGRSIKDKKLERSDSGK